jgi:hypothetical protein
MKNKNNIKRTGLLLIVQLLLVFAAQAQQASWPKTFLADNGTAVKLYQPQPEAYTTGNLQSNAAVSYTEQGKEPVFGVIWFNAGTAENGDNIQLQSARITNIRFPASVNEATSTKVRQLLETQLASAGISLSKASVSSALQLNRQATALSTQLNNNPPAILYASRPTMLVSFDGQPRFEHNNNWNVDVAVNTPYTVIRKDNSFYLYGSSNWYKATSALGDYQPTGSLPSGFDAIAADIRKSNAAKTDDDNSTGDGNNENSNLPDNVIPAIVTATEPTELIQSNGEANFTRIDGTSLLYIQNSGNDIFMDVNTQQYYVLLSGRWFRTSNLRGNWQYIAANSLPADFAKIPSGSAKDNVLASVAGTPASSNAVMDAQVPQTAKVDRKSTTTTVTWDGTPEFEQVNNTNLLYSTNSSAIVLKERSTNTYFTVDNGVWFRASNPNGPWVVSDERPADVALIPPSNAAYNYKYVDIYDVSPDYVYMGYTPGYLNTFVYGPTIVYGTGYYYRPWFQRHYFPRPWTWGFSMNYNPWYGWSFGYGYNAGWFNFGFANYYPHYYYGMYRGGCGWWGPVAYRPAYYGPRFRTYGFYGGRYMPPRSVVVYNRSFTNNIYRNRTGITINNYYGGRNLPYNRGNFYAENGGRINGHNNNFEGNRLDNGDRRIPGGNRNIAPNAGNGNALNPTGGYRPPMRDNGTIAAPGGDRSLQLGQPQRNPATNATDRPAFPDRQPFRQQDNIRRDQQRQLQLQRQQQDRQRQQFQSRPQRSFERPQRVERAAPAPAGGGGGNRLPAPSRRR